MTPPVLVASLMTLVLATSGPVPVSLEVAKDVRAVLDASVLEARLVEEGFALTPQAQAQVRLIVARHPRGLELMALAGGQSFSRVVEAPDEVWPMERTFELAQRLASLAHEAAALAPPPAPPAASAEAPSAAEPPPAVATPLVESSHQAPHFGFVARPGLLVRGVADFSVQAMGVLRLGRLEPLLSLGFVLAPDVGGTAVEFPLLGGVRVVFAPGEHWRLSPEVLVGLRLHVFLDGETGPRVDPALQLGLSVRRQVAQVLWLGLAAYAFLATGRTHLAGDVVLWERGVVGFGAGLDVEF
jgi:hypothetical protein